MIVSLYNYHFVSSIVFNPKYQAKVIHNICINPDVLFLDKPMAMQKNISPIVANIFCLSIVRYLVQTRSNSSNFSFIF